MGLHRTILNINHIEVDFLELLEKKSFVKLKDSQYPEGHTDKFLGGLCLACAIDGYLKELASESINFTGLLTIFTEGIVEDGDTVTTEEVALKLEEMGIVPRIIIYPLVSNRSYLNIRKFANLTHAEVKTFPLKTHMYRLEPEITFDLHKALTLDLSKNMLYPSIMLNIELVNNLKDNVFTFSIDNSISNDKHDIMILAVCFSMECETISWYNFMLLNDGNSQKTFRFSYHFQQNMLMLSGEFRPGLWQLHSYGPNSNHSWVLAAFAQRKFSLEPSSLSDRNKEDPPVTGECWLDKPQSVFELKSEDDQLNAFAFLSQGPLQFLQDVSIELTIYDENNVKVISKFMRDDGAGNPDVTGGDGIWSARIKEKIENNRFYRAEARLSHSSFKINEGFNLLPCCGSRVPEPKVSQTYFHLSRVIDCGHFYIEGNRTLKLMVDKIYDLSVSHLRDNEISVEFSPSRQENMALTHQFKLYNESEFSYLNQPSYVSINGIKLELPSDFIGNHVKLFLKFPDWMEKSKTYLAVILLSNNEGESTVSRVAKFFVKEPPSEGHDNEDNENLPHKTTKLGAWEVVAIVLGSFMFILLILLIIICLIATKMRGATKLDKEKSKLASNDKLPDKSSDLNIRSYESHMPKTLYGKKGYDNKGSNLKDVGAISPVDSIPVNKLMDHYGKVQKAKQRKEPPPVMRLEDITDNVSTVSDNSRFRGSMSMEDAFIPACPELSWKFVDNPNQIITSPYTYVEPQNYFMTQPPPPMFDVWRNSFDRSESPSDYDPRYGTVDKKITVVSQV